MSSNARGPRERSIAASPTRREFLRSAGALAMFSIAAACAPAVPGTGSSPTAPAATGARTQAPPVAKKGGTLTIDIGGGRAIATLDPGSMNLGEEQRVSALVAARLVRPGAQPGQYEPDLLTSWTTNDGGSTWTVQLRKGVKFHDGTPWNTDALKANVDRWLTPGAAPVINARIISMGTSLEVVDEHTAKFRLKTARATFLPTLTRQNAQIMSPKALKEDPKGLATKPIGAGPFIIERMIPAEVVELVRNPDFWDGPPYLDKIVVKRIAEAGARTAALLTKDIDITMTLATSQVARLKQSPGVTVLERGGFRHRFLVLNTQTPAMRTPEARIAASLAVDRAAVAKVAYEGFITPFDSIINPAVSKAPAGAPNLAYAPDKARELVRTAGPDATQMELIYTPEPENQRMAELLQAQFKNVGITLKVTSMDSPTLFARRKEGKFDLATASNPNGDFPGFMIHGVLHRKADTNEGKWGDAKSDEVLEGLIDTVDPAKLESLYREFDRIHVQNPGWLMFGTSPELTATSDRVKDFDFQGHAELHSLAKTWLDG